MRASVLRWLVYALKIRCYIICVLSSTLWKRSLTHDVTETAYPENVVAAKAAAQRVEAEMREMCDDDGEYERELMYESAGLAVFLRSRYDSDD